jgi:type I restriction enzyme S subunit
MSKEMKLIPELRFPEFEKDGEWSEKILGDIADSESSSLALNKIELREEGYSVYGADSVVGYIDEYSQDDKYISIVKDGSGVGRLNLCEPKSSILGTLAYIKSKDKKEFILDWIYYLMNTINFNSYKKGSGIPHIYYSEFKIEPVGVPKPKEQQKIASCLSSLDELIAAHNDKLDALQDHKKGLLQNLFPQEGETVPKVRFPEFEGDGEWVSKTVENLIDEKVLFPPKDGNHGSIHPKSSDYVETGIPFIMASDLKNGKVDYTNCAYLKKEQADSLQKGFAKSGDVLLTHKGTVGEVALLGEFKYPYIMLTPQVTYYRIKDKSKLVNGFLAAFFNSSLFQSHLLKVSGGGTRAYVGITKQRDFYINYPKDPKEQQKIASCLSAVDELITAQQQKIEELQQHKKGLMQGLFPKIEN